MHAPAHSNISFISMQFSAKNLLNVGWRTRFLGWRSTLWEILYPPLPLILTSFSSAESVTIRKCTNEEFSLRCSENCRIEVSSATYGHSGVACHLDRRHCKSNASQVVS